jgi:pimeloyl-ACP methyl ester carboxylesterase
MWKLLLVPALLVGLATPARAEGEYHAASMLEMEANEALFGVEGQDPAQPAPGVNLPCRPSAAHPDPVVLLHGINGNQYNGWAFIGPSLANEGYCVYSLNYGGTGPSDGGTMPIAESAPQIAAYIDAVRAETGASKVDLVGHSEGGFMTEYVPKMIPGAAAKVGKVVALAPPTHGTDLHGVITVVDLLGLRSLVVNGCAACQDELPGGPAVTALNDGPIAQPGIAYTTIISTHDETISPYTTAAIDEPGVRNLVVQDACPLDPVGHAGLAYDSGVLTMVTNALDPAHPEVVSCALGTPL